MSSRELELERIIHVLIEVVEQLCEFVDECLFGCQRLVVACLFCQYLELLRDDAGSDEFLLETIIDVIICARVETTGNEEHSVLREHDVVEKFLYLLCVLFVHNIREIREIRVRLIIAQYLVNLSEFLSDGILVDFDDIEESG